MVDHQTTQPASDQQAAHFLQDLRRLGDMAGAWQPPQLSSTRLVIQAKRVDSVDGVRAALDAFTAHPGCCGWLETPQGVYALGAEQPATRHEVPLHAELACGPESLQLRWADGAWLITHLTEQAMAGTGQPVWAHTVDRLSSLHGVSQWHYRLYFVATAEGCLEPTASRLVAASS